MNNPVASTDIIRVRPSVFLSLFHYFTLFFLSVLLPIPHFLLLLAACEYVEGRGAPLLSYIYIFTFKACMNNVLHFYFLLVIHTWKKLRQQTMESIIKKKGKKPHYLTGGLYLNCSPGAKKEIISLQTNPSKKWKRSHVENSQHVEKRMDTVF